MKILVLENDPKEFTTIQQSLNKNGNELIPLVSSEQIWPYLQSEEPLCLIANWDASDIRNTQFIARARAAKPAEAQKGSFHFQVILPLRVINWKIRQSLTT